MRTRSGWIRSFALCMALVMAFSLMPGTGALVASAAGRTANISSASGLTAEAGSTVTVPVNISDHSGIAGMGLTVTYDKDVLTPVSVEVAELTADDVCDDSIEVEAAGSFKIEWAQKNSENITASGTLFNITFRVSEYAEGDTSIGFAGIKRDTFDEDFNTVTLNCSPAVVTVTPKASTQTTLRGASNLSANSGSDIDIPIFIENPNGVQSLSFGLSYDGDAFAFDHYAAGIAPDSGISIIGGTGNMQVTVSGIPEDASTGILLTLKLKTNEYAGGTFVFDMSSNDVDTQDFRVKVTNTHADENAIISGGEPIIDGQELIVPVRISNNHGMAGFRITVNYDKDVLTPVSVSKAATLKGSFNDSIGDKEGTFDLLWTGTDNITADGELFALTFNIIDLEAKNTVLDLEYTPEDTCDEELNDVLFTMQDIDVTLKDNAKLSSISAFKMKTSYFEGDTLNADDITVTATYSDGSTKEVTGFTTNASDIDMTTAGSKTLVITYTEGDVTETAEIEITVAVTLVSISAVKTKTVYLIGETLNIDDLVVTARYSDGSSREATVYTTNASDLNTNAAGEKALVIYYSEGNVIKNTFVRIYVVPALETITVTKSKTDYHVGDQLNIDDITVTANYSNGTIQEITDFTTNKDDIDMSRAGTKTLIISYSENGRTATSSVILNVTAVLESISAAKTKTDYITGDTLDVDDIIVTAAYNDGSSKEVSGFTTDKDDIDMSTEGEKTLTVSYTEDGVTKTAEVTINVTKPSVPLSSLRAEKVKTDYNVGDELGVDDLTVTAVYEDGSEKEVTDYTTNAASVDMANAGNKTLTISYTEEGVTRTASVTIKVTAVLTSISAAKTKVDYETGDTLNTDDIIVTASYNDGTSKEVTGFTTDAEGIDMSEAGEKTLTISYTEGNITKTATVTINVTAASIPEDPVLKSIAAEKTKKDYHVGDELDVSDVTVTATYSDDSSREVTGFTTNAGDIDMSSAGSKTLIISYTEGEKTATSSVVLNVTAVLGSISAVKTKTEYDTGDILDDSDIIVTAAYSDGTSHDVTGFTTDKDSIDMSTEGEKTLTVSYTEDGVTKETTLAITVKKADVPVQSDLEYIVVEKQKTSYKVGETLSTDDITVTAFYSDQSSKTVTGFTTNKDSIDMSAPGNKTLVVRYTENGKTATSTVQIKVTKNALTSITALKARRIYDIGDTLNTDDIIVTATYSDGSTQEVTGFTTDADDIDMSTAGEKTLTVSYKEDDVTKTAEITIIVKAVLDHITVAKEKTEYETGDDLDISDLTVTAFYNDGTSGEVTGFDTNAESIDMSTAGAKTLVVRYTENGRTATSSVRLTVTAPVQKQLQSIEAVKAKTEYNTGDTLDVDDITVTAIYDDSSSRNVTEFTTNAGDIDMSSEGEKTLTITYTEDGITKETAITIIVSKSQAPGQAVLTGITAKKTKTTYYEWNSIDIDDLTVTASYSDGTSKAVTGYTTNVEEISPVIFPGKEDLIITYTEGEVTVTAKIVITIKALIDLKKAGAKVSGIGSMTYTDALLSSLFYFDKKVIVKIGSKKLVVDEDYWIYSENDQNVGTATIKIYGEGKYTGTITKKIKINPIGTRISKLNAGKKTITVKWKKQAKKMSKSRITGYQIRYSLKSSMKKSKTVTVKGYKKTSKKIKKLKGKKKYYVQIRTYKTVKGKKYYSKWSAKKSIKTKK